MKAVGKTLGDSSELIEVFECELCGMRTRYPENHACRVKIEVPNE